MVIRDQGLLFDPGCRDCARLYSFLEQVRQDHPDSHCKPVAPFGDPEARLVIVGLAPGKHGANATGRPFTGDYAGILLYATLHKFGYASKPQSIHAGDGLTLKDCRITNAVKCLPPQNKPENSEIVLCNRYLRAELRACRQGSVVLALGAVAHKAVLRAFDLTQARFPFEHGGRHTLHDSITLVDSYHCSRYNTQTRRLTVDMFEKVFSDVDQILKRADG